MKTTIRIALMATFAIIVAIMVTIFHPTKLASEPTITDYNVFKVAIGNEVGVCEKKSDEKISCEWQKMTPQNN